MIWMSHDGSVHTDYASYISANNKWNQQEKILKTLQKTENDRYIYSPNTRIQSSSELISSLIILFIIGTIFLITSFYDQFKIVKIPFIIIASISYLLFISLYRTYKNLKKEELEDHLKFEKQQKLKDKYHISDLDEKTDIATAILNFKKCKYKKEIKQLLSYLAKEEYDEYDSITKFTFEESNINIELYDEIILELYEKLGIVYISSDDEYDEYDEYDDLEDITQINLNTRAIKRLIKRLNMEYK